MRRGTMIVYASPEKFEIMACRGRFGATRFSFWSRFFAAWEVFQGRADALSWKYWYCDGHKK